MYSFDRACALAGHGDNTDITADVAELFQNYDLVSHRSCEGKSAWECAREKDAIPTGLVTLMSTVAEYKSDRCTPHN
eukprot:5327845-Amphidinium_carterae.1